MIWHPYILLPKVILFIVLGIVLIVLHGVLTPGQFTVAVVVGVFVFLFLCALMWVLFLKKLRNADSKLARDMILASDMGQRDDFVASPDSFADLVGKRGKALSLLRPSGTVEIDGRRVSVITAGAFIPAGASVEVVSVEGSRVVVKAVSDGGQV